MKMTLTDYARLMGVTYVTAYRWAKLGKIEVEKEGKNVFINAPAEKPSLGAVVYVPIPADKIDAAENVNKVVDIHRAISKNRLKNVRFFYETGDGADKLEEMISAMSQSTVFVLGPGAREHIKRSLGERCGNLLLNTLKHVARRMIDVEEIKNDC
jgi:predicted site-specific integrase-resolvase